MEKEQLNILLVNYPAFVVGHGILLLSEFFLPIVAIVQRRELSIHYN